MTRKEAVAVLEAFIENPLFSNAHKAAFNIAIHDIKQRHDWDINNLILIKNGTPHDDVLDKIRAEIEKERVEIHTIAFKGEYNNLFDDGRHNGLLKALEIIDKYRKGANE